MNKSKDIIVLERTCMDCGHTFKVKINKRTKKILGNHWYFGKHRFGVGDWVYGELKFNPFRIEKTVPLHKEIFYRLRDIYRTLFHKYYEVEFWVCEDCVKAQHGKVKKVKARNPSKRYEERIEIED